MLSFAKTTCTLWLFKLLKSLAFAYSIAFIFDRTRFDFPSYPRLKPRNCKWIAAPMNGLGVLLPYLCSFLGWTVALYIRAIS